MPIYEYECKNCHHTFELMQKINDAPAKQCPRCFEHSVVKLVSSAGFQLKGTGWYATDFKDKKSPSAAKNATPSSNDSSSTPASQPKGSDEKSK